MRRGRVLSRAASLGVIIALAVPCAAIAAAGDLDGSFGSAGVALTDFARRFDGASAVAVQSDGSVLAGGFASGPSGSRFALVRHHPDGTRDPFFGVGGRVTTDFPGPDAQITRLLMLPDGRFVAVGTTTRYTKYGFVDRIVVARYLASGALDASFGRGDGVQAIGPKQLAHIECGVDASGATFDPAGRIVVVGTAGCGGETGYVIAAVARLTPDGQVDVSFARDGARQVGPYCSGDAVAAQPDGKIVIAGTVNYDDYCSDGPMYAARLNADGSNDRSFGRRGGTRIRFRRPYTSAARAVLIDADGRILLAGEAQRYYLDSTGESTFALARLLPDGRLDTSFGTRGLRRVDIRADAHDSIAAIAITPTGAIVAAGESTPTRRWRRSAFAVARYGADGALDRTFGAGGMGWYPFGRASGAADLSLAPDGGVLLAGRIDRRGSDGDFAVLRLMG